MESMPRRICLRASSSLNKYPAKQHAQDAAHKLNADAGLIYLPGQKSQWQEDTDSPFPFRQRRYFYYLSGVDERDCYLTYDIGKDYLTLYIPFRDQRWVVYNGTGLTKDEVLDLYDVDEVKYASEVQQDVRRWTKRRPTTQVYLLHPTQEAFPGQNALPHVDFTKLQMAIDRCRVIKDPHEIELIRTANDISAQAHRTVLTNIVGLQNEAQVEAIFKEICTSRLAKNQAYDVIAAAGSNAAILHYGRNTSSLEGKQLMVLDAGCEWELYASDVTRTFPLSGSWPSKEAHAIYSLVESMQAACIERVKAGVRFLDLHHLAHQIAIKGLLQLGILHNGEEKDILEAGTSLAFFPHGLGHHMGLEVHDVSDVPINSLEQEQPIDPVHAVLLSGGACYAPVDARSGGLEPGMVVTIEPGIYFSRYSIENFYLKSPIHSKYINKSVLEDYYPVGGVRIEDDLLVTKTGYENLTTAPKGEEMLSLIRAGFASPTNAVPHASDLPLSSKVPTADGPPTLRMIQENAAAIGEPIRMRPPISCAYCRKRKMKCKKDGQYPKGFCTRYPERRPDVVNGIPIGADPLPAQHGPSLHDDFHTALLREETRLTHLALPIRPGKTPEVPQKPVEYRASVPNLRKFLIRDGGAEHFASQSRPVLAIPEPEQTFYSEPHDGGVGLAATTRICGLRRAQSQLLPASSLPAVAERQVSRRASLWPAMGDFEEYHKPMQQVSTLTERSITEAGPPEQPVDHDLVLRIAAVTATYLYSVPQNRDKDITGDEVRRILEANPSFMDLCRLLRALNLRVEVADLFKCVVEAVPCANLYALASRGQVGPGRRGDFSK